ncbi:LysR substrate-binding domain-containing protein [Paracoccus benzoatiresistens]|uniref:LysR substrate-binding domain-containing protein n=1 Tax=Paracoccus benzoatiresistens TaxID=2997341 RepID=A0ABT4J1X1_9RHOB|nr:LysR substrate-binding domain-containing protein [Paracoccus sp. EF6]MCZ0961102.1 LysR substrate-binding domain-containing protein [Paracoccus sp. EF6]
MLRRISIKAIQAFEASARLGSFALAADELAVTPSAISHQIRLLEDQLGVALFNRIHRSVILTDVGRDYAAEVMAAFAQIDLATRIASTAQRSKALTIHSTPSFGTQWLMRRLSAFGELYPEIDLRLQSSVNPVNLAQGIIDIDIRYNPGSPPAGTVIRPFPDDVVVPMCSPRLAHGTRPIHRVEDLGAHTLIHGQINVLGWRDWSRRNRRARLDLTRGPSFDRSFMAIRAAADGLGVCLDSMLLAEQELRSGELVVVLPETAMRVHGHGLLALRTKSGTGMVGLFENWLFGELHKTCAWWEGFLAGLTR